MCALTLRNRVSHQVEQLARYLRVSKSIGALELAVRKGKGYARVGVLQLILGTRGAPSGIGNSVETLSLSFKQGKQRREV
jgi:hypothetical protein